MLRPVRVTPPAVPVVTTDEIKEHVAVDFADDDAMLDNLVQSATDHLDGWSGVLGRCLINQEWRLDMRAWPACRRLPLPFPDVSAVAVKYHDADDVEQTVLPALYDFHEDARGSFVWFKDGFASPSVYSDRIDGVQVTFTAGYGAAADDVPQAIRHAIMMLASHWYEHRSAVSIAAGGGSAITVPMAVDTLIAPFRRRRI